MAIKRRITEWAWIDIQDRLCFDIPCLLKVMDVEDTPRNRDLATEEAQKVVREIFPELPQDVNTMDCGTKRVYHGGR